MIHRFDIRSAPRVLLLPAIILVAVAGSVALMLFVQAVLGALALLVSIWISYHIIRYGLYQVRSRITSDEEGVTCLTGMGVETGMNWDSVTHAGVFQIAGDGSLLFIYNEVSDELITIPPIYAELDSLELEIRDRAPRFLELSGETAEKLPDVLRLYLENNV